MAREAWQGRLEKIDDYRWRIPKTHQPGMRVPGLIYADERLLREIKKEQSLNQVANVATLPGIVKYSLAMPDIHWGYGMPIGGVAATDVEKGGVIGAGLVGYDINCGVRLVRTNLKLDDVQPRLEGLVNALFANVPSGVGVGGKIKASGRDEENLLIKGSRWAVEKGFGRPEDLEVTEENGALKEADPSQLSERALKRGVSQTGTLGSGNHFVEVQVIDEIYDEEVASHLNLARGLITVMIHSGSRGLGYQVCDDYAKSMIRSVSKYNIRVPDRQLACVPLNSPEGKSYFAAMACAANYAWANRQCLMHLTREVFERIFNAGPKELGMDLIYDVAHNIAKLERHKVDGKERLLCVHRKGATRAFPAGHPDVPERYKKIGQPVIIPGDMGRNSYLLVGTDQAMEETFGTVCHGAGRVMSRTAAIRTIKSWVLEKELKDKGIIVRAKGRATLAEEAPQAYKDVNDVVRVVHNAGIGRKVCRMRPLGVMKG
jgi:tRNA-splicing ligase RtcB